MMTMTSSTAANLAETEKVKKNIFTFKIVKSNSCSGCDFLRRSDDSGGIAVMLLCNITARPL